MTGNLTPATVAQALARTTTPVAAITAVHLAGRVCDLPALREIADAHDCLLIEDACHAPASIYRDPTGASHTAGSGQHAQLAAYSFHAIKHIAMGEGGAITTADPAFAAKMQALRSHGMSRNSQSWQQPPEPDAPWYYEMAELGYNYRLTDFQCALGRSQLRRLPERLHRRRAIAAFYDQHLNGIPHLKTPPQPAEPGNHAWHLYPIAINFAALGKSRGEIMRALAAQGVGTQVHYIPLHHQPYYQGLTNEPLPGAETYYAQTLSIPIYPQLTDEDLHIIAGTIRATLTDAA